jgi:uncharacterized protein with HEPN domain
MPKSFSEAQRGPDRIGHILDAIAKIRALLKGISFENVENDPNRRAALERYLEIISEASRHIPDAWRKQDGASIPWRDIANVGNIIRHVYMHVDLRIMWNIYENDLEPLKTAIEAMAARHGPPV